MNSEYSFDAAIHNPLDTPLFVPTRVVFELPDSPTNLELRNADGFADGSPYYEIPLAGSLQPGATSPPVTISFRTTNLAQADLSRVRVLGRLEANQIPVIQSTPPTTTTVGAAYSYPLLASDPDGSGLAFELTGRGPSGEFLHPTSGLLSWSPTIAHAASEPFAVRLYDSRGGSTSQTWNVSVAGVNSRPVFVSQDNVTAREGDFIHLRAGDSIVTEIHSSIGPTVCRRERSLTLTISQFRGRQTTHPPVAIPM